MRRRWAAGRRRPSSDSRASLGQLGAMVPRFEDALDIPKGGVLLALPALLVSGLLRHASQYFQLPPGGSTARDDLSAPGLHGARTPQIHRGPCTYCAPGEWGKLLGLDRIPEVRTLRAKLKHLAEQKQAFEWSATLCTEWMAVAPEEAAVPIR